MKLFVVIPCFYRKFELSRIWYKPKPNPNPGPGGLVLCTSVTTYNGKPTQKYKTNQRRFRFSRSACVAAWFTLQRHSNVVETWNYYLGVRASIGPCFWRLASVLMFRWRSSTVQMRYRMLQSIPSPYCFSCDRYITCNKDHLKLKLVDKGLISFLLT